MYQPIERHESGPLKFSRPNANGIDDGDLGDGEKIEEIMMEIQNLFSLHKVTIHGKELKLKDFPDTADRGVPDKVPDIPAVLKIKYVLGKKELSIHWDNANPYKKTFVVRVEMHDPDDYDRYDEIDLRKTTKNSTKVDVTSVDTTGSSLFTVKVTVQTGEDNITEEQWDAMKGQTIDFRDEDVTINKYRMNPSHSLYPVDKFRLEICDKYKTIYDLFALFPESKSQNFINSCAIIYGKLLELRLDTQVVPWEYLKIPIRWNTLSYGQKVLVILQKTIQHDDTMEAKIKSLYYADIIDKPYAIDPAKGGSQRVTGAKRPYHALTTIPTQLDSTFVNRGNQYKAEQIRDLIRRSTWKNSQQYFKKNSVIYGKEFHEFIYLDNRLEREACDTLRRIDRLLRLSKERGYPVLNKDVAAPHNYSTNTSTHRDTTFGVNNYDRTQSYPPVQPAPLIMAAEGDGESTSIKVEDSQPPFDRRDMVKRTKLVKVLKVNTGNDDIYYNHPLYRSKQKKQSNESIQSYRGPPPRTPPPGLPSEDLDELNREMVRLEAQFNEYEKEIKTIEDKISEVEEKLPNGTSKEDLRVLKEYKKAIQQKFFDVGGRIDMVAFKMSQLEGPQEDSFTRRVSELEEEVKDLEQIWKLTDEKLLQAENSKDKEKINKLAEELKAIGKKIESKEKEIEALTKPDDMM